jgi:hypothetical protein
VMECDTISLSKDNAAVVKLQFRKRSEAELVS